MTVSLVHVNCCRGQDITKNRGNKELALFTCGLFSVNLRGISPAKSKSPDEFPSIVQIYVVTLFIAMLVGGGT